MMWRTSRVSLKSHSHLQPHRLTDELPYSFVPRVYSTASSPFRKPPPAEEQLGKPSSSFRKLSNSLDRSTRRSSLLGL